MAGQRRVTKAGIEVLASNKQGQRVTKAGAEVLATNPEGLRVTKAGIEVLGHGLDGIRVTKAGAEVLAFAPSGSRVTKAGAEVLATNPEGLRVTKAGIEVLGDAPQVIVPVAVDFPLPVFLDSNWIQGAFLDTTWQTDISNARDTGLQDRVGLFSRPLRALTVYLSGLNSVDSYKLLTGLSRRGTAPLPFPLFCDKSVVTQDSILPSISCPTDNRRFHLGQRILILTDYLATETYATVVSLTSNSITVDTAPGTSLVVGDVVYPLVDAEVTLQTNMSLVTDTITNASLTILEKAGQNTLPATLNGSETIPSTYEGYPIFDLPIQWVSAIVVTILRDGEILGVGRGSIVDALGEKSYMKFSFPIFEGLRKDIWKLVRLFDQCRGRLSPFWLASPQTAWTLIQINDSPENWVDIEPSGNFEDLLVMYYAMALEFQEGITRIYRISKIEDLGASWRISTNDNIVLTSPVTRVASAHLVRFDEDNITEQWITTEVCSIQVSATEIRVERPTEIPNLGPDG